MVVLRFVVCWVNCYLSVVAVYGLCLGCDCACCCFTGGWLIVLIDSASFFVDFVWLLLFMFGVSCLFAICWFAFWFLCWGFRLLFLLVCAGLFYCLVGFTMRYYLIVCCFVMMLYVLCLLTVLFRLSWNCGWYLIVIYDYLAGLVYAVWLLCCLL